MRTASETTMFLTVCVVGSSPTGGAKKKHFLLGSVSFCVCVRRTQHRLTASGQHHFEQSENIVFNKRTQNEVAFGKQCCASHKRCGLANDVALRANVWYNLYHKRGDSNERR